MINRQTTWKYEENWGRKGGKRGKKTDLLLVDQLFVEFINKLQRRRKDAKKQGRTEQGNRGSRAELKG